MMPCAMQPGCPCSCQLQCMPGVQCMPDVQTEETLLHHVDTSAHGSCKKQASTAHLNIVFGEAWNICIPPVRVPGLLHIHLQILATLRWCRALYLFKATESENSLADTAPHMGCHRVMGQHAHAHEALTGNQRFCCWLDLCCLADQPLGPSSQLMAPDIGPIMGIWKGSIMRLFQLRLEGPHMCAEGAT